MNYHWKWHAITSAICHGHTDRPWYNGRGDYTRLWISVGEIIEGPSWSLATTVVEGAPFSEPRSSWIAASADCKLGASSVSLGRRSWNCDDLQMTHKRLSYFMSYFQAEMDFSPKWVRKKGLWWRRTSFQSRLPLYSKKFECRAVPAVNS